MTIAAEVGIMPEQFWVITERELVAAIKGHRKRQIEEWRRTRLGAYMVYASNSTNPQRIEQWMPIEGDPVINYRKEMNKIKRMSKKADKFWPELN